MTGKSLQPTSIDLDRLHQAATIAAEIVSKFGDDYWPIFERIELELQSRQDRQSRLSRFVSASDVE